MAKKSAKFSVAVLCGGPSLERGISLNSARSLMDHLKSEQIEIVPIYFDNKKQAYQISQAQLYSNTPSDFDFKLQQTATPLTTAALVKKLREVAITFPAMHGPFGEDGGIQRFLEKHAIPFVGSGSKACRLAFDKHTANTFIAGHDFFTLPSAVLKIFHTDHEKILKDFFANNKVQRAVVKPASGGSSIGVFSVATPQEALEKTKLIFSKRMDTRVVVEPFAQGKEFTMIILENQFALPVALPPTEIETDYTEHQIFDFRRKYLPTRQVTWHCPPRFSQEIIERIQAQGEQLFRLFGMHDAARFDGWVLPNGKIWFCDFNTVSGMEQNSFLFQQAARVGLTHRDVLQYIVQHSSARQGVHFPEISSQKKKGKTVTILMGGSNSERQVSLMSGTNVWLKLRQTKEYEPQPYLLDTHGDVWKLPYHLSLNHTVEEIMENCQQYPNEKHRLEDFERRARIKLGLREEKNAQDFFDPRKLSLNELLHSSSFLFIALHGGKGEDGTLQAACEKAKVKFNGSPATTSQLCMDKWKTAEAIRQLNIPGVQAIAGESFLTSTLLHMTSSQIEALWKKLHTELHSKTFIIKPQSDGCTTGVAHIFTAQDLKTYLAYLQKRAAYIPKNTFHGQADIIELPSAAPKRLLIERFIATDKLRVKANKMKHLPVSGWVEMTAGVIEVRGKIHALAPSITIAEGEVLTVEEKFQGGTGINITPPPEHLIQGSTVEKVRQRIAELATALGIRGYARIDIFVHLKTGAIHVIEVNTLPGLTGSTVIYHQALADQPPKFPAEFLSTIIANTGY
ncbi:MAG: hypothetical protein H6760_05030 [Candidatus Nomurabacteria bacterium]|nr:MAG: hypothetical protein H6760_05030 [Candidatus Nomurabacteria bacterium]